MTIANYGSDKITVTCTNNNDNSQIFQVDVDPGEFVQPSVPSTDTNIKLTMSENVNWVGQGNWGDYGAPFGVFGIWKEQSGEYNFNGSNRQS